jgi:hypothetical protein
VPKAERKHLFDLNDKCLILNIFDPDNYSAELLLLLLPSVRATVQIAANPVSQNHTEAV